MSSSVAAPPGAPTFYECIVRPSLANDGSWIVEYPDLPGCFAQTGSRKEAHDLSESLLASWLERAKALGIEPATAGERTVSTVRVRTARTLHRDLVIFADQSGLSLNETVVQLLYSGVGRWLNASCSTSGVCMADSVVVPRRTTNSRPGPKPSSDKIYSGSWLQRLPSVLLRHIDSIRKQDGGLSTNMAVNLIIARELERAIQQLNLSGSFSHAA